MLPKRFPKQTQMNNFFPNVSKGIHKLNTAKQFLMDSDRQKQEAEGKKKADADKIAANDKEKRQARERIIQQRQELIDVNNANLEVAEFMGESEVRQIYDNIDTAVDVDVTSVKRKKKAKAWNQRPQNWKDMAGHYLSYGLDGIEQDYVEEMAVMPKERKALERKLRLWVKDLNAGKQPGYAHRQPGYIFFD